MFKTVCLAIAFFGACGLYNAAGATENGRDLETQHDKTSYGIGLDIGRDIAKQSLEIDNELLLKGISDGLTNKEPLLSDKEIEQVREDFSRTRKAAMEKERQAAAEKNLNEGKAFLAENTKKKEIITLASGLQYQIVTPGTGASPKAEDNVKVHYRGMFPDGTEFDSSYTRGKPSVFPVNGVIPGWTEALQLMREGSKWKIFVPSNLAYGEKGAGRLIGPNQVLIFDIELLTIH